MSPFNVTLSIIYAYTHVPSDFCSMFTTYGLKSYEVHRSISLYFPSCTKLIIFS